MKLLGDKIFIRITKENRESIFSKWIETNDGRRVKLFVNVEAKDDMDARKSALFVQTAIVEDVSPSVTFVKKGDIAILDYTVCNDPMNKVMKDGEDDILWLNATTTYHDTDVTAYKTRKSNRDQIVHLKGDFDMMSMLLGVVRGEELIANDPYVFLAHESSIIKLVSPSGILYSKKQKVVTRTVLSISERSSTLYGVKKGDRVILDDYDIFDVTLDGKTIQAVNDVDLLLKEESRQESEEMKVV